MNISGEEEKITILKKETPVTVTEADYEDEGNDWRGPIIDQLTHGRTSSPLAELMNYSILGGKLYFRNPGGVLSLCIGPARAKEELERMHAESCGEVDLPLYRRIQRKGYYWPTMSGDAADLQKSCPNCQRFPKDIECFGASFDPDWREPYKQYLSGGILPEDKMEAMILKKRAYNFFLRDRQLYRHGYMNTSLRCLSNGETLAVLREAHLPAHLSGAKLYEQLLGLGYYWPTIEKDANTFAKRCKPCQEHGNLIHAPTVPPIQSPRHIHFIPGPLT